MRKFKRWVASALSALLLLTLLPAGALAAEDSPGDGTLTAETAPIDEDQAAKDAPADEAQPPKDPPKDSAAEGRESEAPQSEAGITPASLLPLDYEELDVDLTMYFRQELDDVGLDILLKDAETPPEENSVISWALWGDDDYTTVEPGKGIDFTTEELSGFDNLEMELVVGTADPTDPQNKRYVLQMVLPSRIMYPEELLEFRLYGEQTGDIKIHEIDHELWFSNVPGYAEDDPTFCTLMIGSDDSAKNEEDDLYLRLNFADHPALSGLTDEDVTVYEGFFRSMDKIVEANEQPITEQIWNPSDSKGYQGNQYLHRSPLTVVFRRAGKAVMVLPFQVDPGTGRHLLIEPHSALYGIDAETGNRVQVATTDWPGIQETASWSGWYTAIDPSIKVDGEYYLGLKIKSLNPDDDDSDNGIHLVKSAYRGLYSESDLPADAVDIKDQLFTDASTNGGYRCDFSEGTDFTIFTTWGRLWFDAKLEPYRGSQIGPPDADDTARPDPYFRMEGALTEENGSPFTNAYLMQSKDDSYYANGYQTVFLLNDDNSPLAEGTTIYPTFRTYLNDETQDEETVRVYAGAGAISGERKYSGKSGYAFRSGETIQYSAATGDTAETSTHLKNYWVTFLTQQQGKAQLFVNGASNSAHLDEDENLPVREVFLDDLHNNRHDIFLANLGDQPLTGLKVEVLEPLVNVQFDPYWAIGGAGQTNTLAAFTSTENKSANGETDPRGELPNVAKLRLIPTDTRGQISGKIKISAANGDEETIILKGTSGVPHISTETLLPGVQYVPYSSLIQTDNMYDSGAIRFELDSGNALPDGMELRPNGEIYGVPKTTGDFTFTVRAVYNNDPNTETKKTFTLHIVGNEDETVWNATDAEYDVIECVGEIVDGESRNPSDYILEQYADQVFTSKGPYYYFVDFWIDGDRQARGTDYRSEEGSTKITILSQTLQKYGQGTHTISAEFREGNPQTGALKRAAQNYRIEVPAPSTGGNTKPGGSHSSSHRPSSSTSQTAKKDKDADQDEKTPSTEREPETGFSDVPASSWFHDDVTWAAGNGLMVGTSSRRFSPEDAVSQAIIVTTLARMSDVDLSRYETETDPDIEAGQWFTAAAIWAKRAGLLPDHSRFTGTDSISRSQMAAMLVKYLRRVGVDTEIAEGSPLFADAEQMTAEENRDFQVLYRYGIFMGVGGNRMDPTGTTTRSQFAALLHRLSETIAAQS